MGETDDEKTCIEGILTIPYVLGGITVVILLSVTLAGVVIELLEKKELPEWIETKAAPLSFRCGNDRAPVTDVTCIFPGIW